MVSVDSLEKGIANYIDAEIFELLPQNGWQKVALGTAMSIAIKKAGNVTQSLSENQILVAMGVVSEEGIDLDLLKESLKENIPEKGMNVNVPLLGEMIFFKKDVDVLCEYIEGV